VWIFLSSSPYRQQILPIPAGCPLAHQHHPDRGIAHTLELPLAELYLLLLALQQALNNLAQCWLQHNLAPSNRIDSLVLCVPSLLSTKNSNPCWTKLPAEGLSSACTPSWLWCISSSAWISLVGRIISPAAGSSTSLGPAPCSSLSGTNGSSAGTIHWHSLKYIRIDTQA